MSITRSMEAKSSAPRRPFILSTAGLLVLAALSSTLVAVSVEAGQTKMLLMTMNSMMTAIKRGHAIIKNGDSICSWIWTSFNKTVEDIVIEASQELASDMITDSLNGPDKTCRKE